MLALLALAWASLVAIVLVAPELYDQALRLLAGEHKKAELAFLAVISALVGLLGIGTIRRWRWTFWLIMVAFLFGVLCVPASGLEMAGVLPATGPSWYVLFHAVLGLVQFGIGLAMLTSYRRAGVWDLALTVADFTTPAACGESVGRLAQARARL
ncbi:MAG: hypothetical protein M3069_02795 [Chloroflexota bacterium]|nr:hypothetical protein [Chloroflexota bacterium]